MSKKPHSTESFATYVLAVMAISLTIVGAISVGAVTPTYESARQDYKPSQLHLFNAKAFRQAIRDRAAIRAGRLSDRQDTSDTAAQDRAVESVTPQDPTPEPTDVAVDTPLRVTDLTPGQMRDLRHFLRIKACPTLVETRTNPERPAIRAFRQLCEKMLARQARREILRGAANPHQRGDAVSVDE